MNREILFRGKRICDNKFIEGDLLSDGITTVIRVHLSKYRDDYDDYEVDEDSVGQFTGIIDTNGVKIFEDDIVSGISKNTAYVVRFENGAFFTNVCLVSFGDHTVIGNIHDTPELLK